MRLVAATIHNRIISLHGTLGRVLLCFIVFQRCNCAHTSFWHRYAFLLQVQYKNVIGYPCISSAIRQKQQLLLPWIGKEISCKCNKQQPQSYSGVATLVASQRATSCRLKMTIHQLGTNDNEDVSRILLNESPEFNKQLQELIRQRAEARWQGDYEKADRLRTEMDQLVQDHLPRHRLLLHDVPRKDGGGSTWDLVRTVTEEDDEVQHSLPGPTVLQLAHVALGLAISSSYRGIIISSTTVDNTQLNNLVEQAKIRLQDPLAVKIELQGRKAADAAFWFALAGVTDDDLFSTLADIAKKELERFGERASCRSKDVLHILHRLAAAGIRNDNGELQRVANTCLAKKMSNAPNFRLPKDDHTSFHSDACRLLIWKFSTRQKKQQMFMQSASQHWDRYSKNEGAQDSSLIMPDAVAPPPSLNNDLTSAVDWNHIFTDPNLPLVIDVGCGMGVSLLGLATLSDQDATTTSSSLLGGGGGGNSTSGNDRSWFNCNLMGVDHSALAIGYARGLSHRWRLDGRLYFGHGSVEPWLEKIRDTYPGPVQLCMIQFPTPFLLPLTPWQRSTSTPITAKSRNHVVDEPSTAAITPTTSLQLEPVPIRRGNSQLPTSAENGFMVTPQLLQLIHQALRGSNNNKNNNSMNSGNASEREPGRLLVQSNCEDVALWIQQVACEQVGFSALPFDASTMEQSHYKDDDDNVMHVPTPTRVPKRTMDWIAMGGERATGDAWSIAPLLPRQGATETEIACIMNGTPVHRCVLVPSLQQG